MTLPRAKTGRARAVVCAALVCLLAAPVASPYPEEYAPFDGQAPPVISTYPCGIVATDKTSSEGTLTYARLDGKPAAGRVRISRGSGTESSAVFMSVVDASGRILAGPRRIADSAVVIPPVFWADLNGDGREDFIALAVTAFGDSACKCDMGFALSSGKGYRITSVRSTHGPGANDFLDLGKGRVGFIHTALINKRDPAKPKAAPTSFFVYSLLEVKGDRLILAKADTRFASFPKWVRVATKKKRANAPTLAEAEKKRLQSEVAARIFRGPQFEGATEVASAPE
jgi:hypothetical protein